MNFFKQRRGKQKGAITGGKGRNVMALLRAAVALNKSSMFPGEKMTSNRNGVSIKLHQA